MNHQNISQSIIHKASISLSHPLFNHKNSDCAFFTVAGSSGCGKTSLIFTLARGLFPDPDWVPGRFDGKDTRAFSENTANLEAFF